MACASLLSSMTDKKKNHVTGKLESYRPKYNENIHTQFKVLACCMASLNSQMAGSRFWSSIVQSMRAPLRSRAATILGLHFRTA